MRAGAGHVLLSLALASLVPVLFLSTSIKQLKHSLLCKQSLVGFMELRVTMCLSPGPSPCGLLEMQFSLSFGACPCSSLGTCCRPCVSLSCPSPGDSQG